MYDGDYLISTRYRGSCWVKARDNIIVDTGPLWRRFIGQSVDNLTRWLIYFKATKLGDDSDELLQTGAR